jgi:hypothetical protein
MFPPNPSGGSSSLFLGWFTSLTDLQTAYPSADSGQYAYVVVAGSPVIYTWSSTTNTWVSSGLGGIVTTVTQNGSTESGDVTVSLSKLGLVNSDDLTEGTTNLFNRPANWAQTDADDPEFIKNKPDLSKYLVKLLSFNEHDFVSITATGGIQDSGYKVNDYGTGYLDVWSAQKIRDEIDESVNEAIKVIGTWDAASNVPDIANFPSLSVGYAWVVSVPGTTTVGDISTWSEGELAVYGQSGWFKIGASTTVTFENIQGNALDNDSLADALNSKLGVTGTAYDSTRLGGVLYSDYASKSDLPIAGNGLTENEFGTWNVNVDGTTIIINGNDQLEVVASSGGPGNVIGPASSGINNIVLFGNTSGDHVIDSHVNFYEFATMTDVFVSYPTIVANTAVGNVDPGYIMSGKSVQGVLMDLFNAVVVYPAQIPYYFGMFSNPATDLITESIVKGLEQTLYETESTKVFDFGTLVTNVGYVGLSYPLSYGILTGIEVAAGLVATDLMLDFGSVVVEVNNFDYIVYVYKYLSNIPAGEYKMRFILGDD